MYAVMYMSMQSTRKITYIVITRNRVKEPVHTKNQPPNCLIPFDSFPLSAFPFLSLSLYANVPADVELHYASNVLQINIKTVIPAHTIKKH